MNKKVEDEITLKKIACIISEHPRYTMKEIAESAGISKATIHRVYGSRENLNGILLQMAKETIKEITRVISEKSCDFDNRLKKIAKIHFANKEMIYFASANEVCDGDVCGNDYIKALDQFFEEGQKEGYFFKEISNHAMTETFIALFCGMSEAAKRGRIEEKETEKIFLRLLRNGVCS